MDSKIPAVALIGNSKTHPNVNMEINNITVAQRLISLCNSLAITCIQNHLYDLALSYAFKAYLTDLVIFEAETDFQD